jgi:hypothetical protein
MENGSLTNEELIRWATGPSGSIVTSKRLFNERSTGRKYIVGTIHDIPDLKSKQKQGCGKANINTMICSTMPVIIIFTVSRMENSPMQTRQCSKGLGFDKRLRISISEFIKPKCWQNQRINHEGIDKERAISSIEIETPGKIGKPRCWRSV